MRPSGAGVWALLLFVVPAAALAAGPVAEVVRIKGAAVARHSGTEIPLTVGAPIEVLDTVETAAGARVELRFTDGAGLTLGERTRAVVSEYVFAPEVDGRGVLEVAGGAFAVATGALARLEGAPFTVKTPHASIGVRGTRFWGGALEGKEEFGVLVLEGAVSVGNEAGTVLLEGEGAGTVIPSVGAPPGAPVRWSRERVGRALTTVSFE